MLVASIQEKSLVGMIDGSVPGLLLRVEPIGVLLLKVGVLNSGSDQGAFGCRYA